MKNLKEAVGLKIKSVEVIQAEFGRTYHHYTCIVFDNGEKIILGGDDLQAWEAHPEPKHMSDAPNYFSPEDIATEVVRVENIRRKRNKEIEDKEKREFERLQAKYSQETKAQL